MNQLSIIIPTYNCAKFLRETLERLKKQWDDIKDAQIVVVDDCSSDTPEKVVEEVMGDRVKFIRNAKNLGPAANFNNCINIAERQWIHLLHGDDYPTDTCYREFSRIVKNFPEADIVFGAVFIVDEAGTVLSQVPSLGGCSEGWYDYDPNDWRACLPQFAGVFFKKEAAELVGGFDTSYQCVQDWKLWWKLARKYQSVSTPRILGNYRVFTTNHSSGAMREGKIFLEAKRFLDEQLQAKENDSNRRKPEQFYDPAVTMILHGMKRIRKLPGICVGLGVLRKTPMKPTQRARHIVEELRYIIKV